MVFFNIHKFWFKTVWHALEFMKVNPKVYQIKKTARFLFLRISSYFFVQICEDLQLDLNFLYIKDKNSTCL